MKYVAVFFLSVALILIGDGFRKLFAYVRNCFIHFVWFFGELYAEIVDFFVDFALTFIDIIKKIRSLE